MDNIISHRFINLCNLTRPSGLVLMVILIYSRISRSNFVGQTLFKKLYILVENQHAMLGHTTCTTCEGSPTWQHAIIPILSEIMPIMKDATDMTRRDPV